MKPMFWRTFLVVVVAIVMLGLSVIASQSLLPTATDGAKDNRSFAENDGTARKAADWIQDRSKVTIVNLINRSAADYELELAEIVARTVTFPPVLRRGETLIKMQYPNSQLFCVDSVYYAGRAMGLILAMDRRAVDEHALFWTIDVAGEVFDNCQLLLLREYFADKSVDAGIQMGNEHKEVVEKIELIQAELRRAQKVKFKPREFSVGHGAPDAARNLARR